MAWWNPLDWLPLSSDGKSVNELEREGAAADARLDELNGRARELYGPPWWEEVQANRGTSSRAEDYRGEIYAEGLAGAREGLANVADAVTRPVSRVPTQWLVLGAVALFLWAGGLGWLRGRLGK